MAGHGKRSGAVIAGWMRHRNRILNGSTRILKKSSLPGTSPKRDHLSILRPQVSSLKTDFNNQNVSSLTVGARLIYFDWLDSWFIHPTRNAGCDNVQYLSHIIIGPKRKALDLVEKKSGNKNILSNRERAYL
jgi:hypothetical protein